MSLPEIDIAKISGLKTAKEVIQQLMNLLERSISETNRLLKREQELEAEIAKLNKQSRKPGFGKGRVIGNKDKKDYSSKKFLLQGLKWIKGEKKAKLEIDRHETLPEVLECECGGREFTIIDKWNKVIQGLIIKRDNVKYYGNTKVCKSCGKKHRSQIPDGIKGLQFSGELRSWISTFKYHCRMSEVLIYEFLTGLGIQISIGQINRVVLQNSKLLSTVYSHLVVWGVKLSQYLHTDATGFIRWLKSGKKVQEHLHIVSHQYLSLFVITHKYNSLQIMEKVLKKTGLLKRLITDDHSAYGRLLLIAIKQLCWVHEIRHYLKLKPHFQTNRKILEKVIDELWEWYKLAAIYVRGPTEEIRHRLAYRFTEITSQQTGYEELDERLKLTNNKQLRLLHFLDNPGLPIQNNQAERDLRKAVIIRKLSGGTKSKEGNRSFERHMSVIETTRKQGLNVFETLHGLLTRQLDPCVLTAKKQPLMTSL